MTLTLFPAYALEEETVDGVIPGSEERISDEPGTDEASSGLADTPHSTDEDLQNIETETASPAGAADVTDTLAGQESPAESGLAVLFENSDTMTRGAWMRELVNLFGLTLKKDEYPDVYFPDIAESEYYDDIMVATKYGFVDVEAGDNFEPDAPLMRETAAWTLNFELGIQNEREHYTFSDADSVTHPDDAQVALDCGWFALQDGKFNQETEVLSHEIEAMKSYATETLERRRIDNERSDYQFADYVKEIPSTAIIHSVTDLETGDTTLTVSGYEGTLAINDTIVFYSDGFAFVYGVESVSESNGVLTVVTKEAPDDAIGRFEFIGEMEPELSLYMPEGLETATLTAADGDPVTIGEAVLLDSGKGKISYERKIAKGDIGDKAVTGKITVTIDHVKLDKKLTGNNQYIAVQGKLSMTSTLEVDFLNDEAADRLFLGGVTIGSFGTFGVELSLKMKASISYECSANFSIGVEKTGSLLSVMKSWDTNSSCLSAKGTVSAMLSIAFRLNFGKVAWFNATVDAGPKIEATSKKYSSGTPQQCINVSGYLYAGAKINAKLGDLSIDYSWDFFRESTSPIRIVDHIEDGQSVSACSRGKDAGTTTGDYQTPKYITPSNSRYYASGASNASSYGYGGYGNAEPVVIWKTSDNEDGTVTIIGYSGNASILNIPEIIDGKTVTAIGKDAFKNKSEIRMVNIPDTVMSIGGYAFQNCTSLKLAVLPDTITSISGHAFYNCTALESINIPGQLERVGGVSVPTVYAPFGNCNNLTNITFGDGITSIPAHLFEYCTGLVNISIPDTVTEIGGYAFQNCTSLKLAVLPDTITSISGHAFYNCTALESINIPGQLERVGGVSVPTVYAPFGNCNNLTNITFGDGITSIPAYLFEDGAGPASLEIPETVTSIGENSFKGSGITTVHIPDRVIVIGKNAFYNSRLTNITIPDSITSYSNGILSNCAELVSVKLSINALTIPSSMFSGCSSLESIEIPNGVTELKNDTFSGCSSLKSATLPDSVTKIGNNAFKGCASLTDLTWMPYTVTSIGSNAFENCTGLTSAELPDLVSSLGGSAFKGCTSLAAFHGGADLLTIGANCFQDCAALTDVDLVDGLAAIGNYAFQNCAKLETIVLPDSVTSVGTYIFQKDPALKNVTLSKGLTVIPSYAFANCTAMTELAIPKGVTTIKDHAFYQDTALKTFTIPESVASIENNAFSYPTTTTVYGVPGSYAETYAKWQAFIDVTKGTGSIALASGADTMTIGNGLTVTPVFVFSPTDSTETVTMVSDNTNVVSVENGGVSIRGRRNGTANITATTSGNRSCTFAVTVDRLSGIEIARQPDVTAFDVGARKDLTGLVVNAVFSNGNREWIYDYTVSGFTTDQAGTYTVTASYNRQTASFQITVGGGDPGLKSGAMGNNGELYWTYRESTGQITVTGPVNNNDAVFVACYDANGKMLSVETITVSGGTIQTVSGTSAVGLFWLDSRLAPKCGKETIHCS